MTLGRGGRAWWTANVERRSAAGKIKALEEVLAADPLNATVGIGHTRWADPRRTLHEERPPAHRRARAATLVHNGIIENYAELRDMLKAKGRSWRARPTPRSSPH